MRPSLEAELIDLEKRIATLEKNKIGNLRREHGEIISTYEKMFDTLRYVNFNKILMILKINMMEIKSLEEDCSRECTKNQLVILLQKEMATCLMKMIQIGQEENSLLLETNQRLRDKIRLKRLEISKMTDEREKLLAKIYCENKVVVKEKTINRYCIPVSSKCDIFSPTFNTAGYHPKVLRQSKIPVLKLPLTSVVETVPFQIRKKPIKVTIPHDRLSIFKKPNPGRVVKQKITHNCEKNTSPKTESFRLGEKQKQIGKRCGARKSSINFTVTNSKTKINLNNNVKIAQKTDVNSINNNHVLTANKSNMNFTDDDLQIVNKSNVNSTVDNMEIVDKINVENNSTPRSASKIPVRVTAASANKSSNKQNRNCPENLTFAGAKLNGVLGDGEKLIKNNNYYNNKPAVTVEEAAIVFKCLNDYCDKIEQMYGKYETSPSNSIEKELAEKRKSVHKKPIMRKPVLCNIGPCLPMKFRSEKKPNSQEYAAKTDEKFYGSTESIGWNNPDEKNGETSLIENTSYTAQAPDEHHQTAEEESSSLSSSTMNSSETGTTVISVDLSINGNTSNRDDSCEFSPCFETILSASKCFTPPNDQFRAGGDCLNSSIAGNFRFLDSDSENSSPNTPHKLAQRRSDAGHQESSDSSYIVNGKRRKSEIFHISFNSDRKRELSKDKFSPPSVFKVL